MNATMYGGDCRRLEKEEEDAKKEKKARDLELEQKEQARKVDDITAQKDQAVAATGLAGLLSVVNVLGERAAAAADVGPTGSKKTKVPARTTKGGLAPPETRRPPPPARSSPKKTKVSTLAFDQTNADVTLCLE
jgi:hypothetical protein